jgi:hypothetical protein
MQCSTCLTNDDSKLKYCYTIDSINRKVYRQYCTVCLGFVGTMVKKEVAESCGYDLIYHDGNADKYKVQQYMKDVFIPANNSHYERCLGDLIIGYVDMSDTYKAYEVYCDDCHEIIANPPTKVVDAWEFYYEEGVVNEGMALTLMQMTTSMVDLTPYQPKHSHKIPKLLLEQYNDYMQSPKWKRQRDNRMAIDNNECKLCFSKVNLHVHHITYDNFGNEPMKELITVCKSCHETIHGHEIN